MCIERHPKNSLSNHRVVCALVKLQDFQLKVSWISVSFSWVSGQSKLGKGKWKLSVTLTLAGGDWSASSKLSKQYSVTVI